MVCPHLLLTHIGSLMHHEAIQVDVTNLNLTEELMIAYAKKLRQVFDRVPTFFALMSAHQKEWAKRAALKLVFDDNKNAKLFVSKPTYSEKKGHVLCPVYGYDQTKNEAWYQRLTVPVGALDQRKKMLISDAQRVEFVDASDLAAPFGKPATRTSSVAEAASLPKDVQTAIKLGEMLTAQFFGFVDTIKTVIIKLLK